MIKYRTVVTWLLVLTVSILMTGCTMSGVETEYHIPKLHDITEPVIDENSDSDTKLIITGDIAEDGHFVFKDKKAVLKTEFKGKHKNLLDKSDAKVKWISSHSYAETKAIYSNGIYSNGKVDTDGHDYDDPNEVIKTSGKHNEVCTITLKEGKSTVLRMRAKVEIDGREYTCAVTTKDMEYID